MAFFATSRRARSFFTKALAAIFLCAAPSLAAEQSAVPLALTVQGELTDTSGEPLSGVQEFEINIYFNGTSLWRTGYKVGVINGAFVQIGRAHV